MSAIDDLVKNRFPVWATGQRIEIVDRQQRAVVITVEGSRVETGKFGCIVNLHANALLARETGGGVEQVSLAAAAAAEKTQLVFTAAGHLVAQAFYDQACALAKKIIQAEMPIQLQG